MAIEPTRRGRGRSKAATPLGPSRVIEPLGGHTIRLGLVPVPPECPSIPSIRKERPASARGNASFCFGNKIVPDSNNLLIAISGRKPFRPVAIGHQTDTFGTACPRVVVSVTGDVVEVSGERKIITLRDRIRFVVVTSRAAKRHAQRKLGRGIHNVCSLIGLGLNAIRRLIVPDPKAKVSGRQFCRNGMIIKVRQLVVFVAGKLVTKERVVGKVFIQSTNDPISVPPDIRLRAVAFVTVGFREPNLVQPKSCPVLAVGR